MIHQLIVILSNDAPEKTILTEKSFDDCQHIAVALQNECDVITSWNFKHMVNVKTINGVRAISMIKGYKTINIIDPLTVLEMEV